MYFICGMKVPALLLLAVFFSAALHAQLLNYDQLNSVLSMKQYEIDTLMKKTNYKLLQKEEDSTSSLHYYSNLEKITDGPAWVRSISVMDASLNGMSSRLIKYRTYSKEEFQQFMAALLSHNFHTANKFVMGNAQHTVYEDGSRSILVKITNTPLTNGKVLPTYEFEIGK